MERYKIINAVRIQSETSDEFDYYHLTLESSKGIVLLAKDDEDPSKTLSYTASMSTKQLHRLFKEQELPVDDFLPFETKRLINSATLRASLPFKKKGEDFVASEFTMVPSGEVDEDGEPIWTSAEAGETYEVQVSGYRFDYDSHLSIDFDYDLAERFIDKSMLRKEREAQRLASANLV